MEQRPPFIHIFILLAFLFNTLGPIPIAQADDLRLPAPGVMVHLSQLPSEVALNDLAPERMRQVLFQ